MSNGMTKEQHHEFMANWKKENNIPEEWPQYDLDMLWAKHEMFKRITGEDLTLEFFSKSWTDHFKEHQKAGLKHIMDSEKTKEFIKENGIPDDVVADVLDGFAEKKGIL